MLSTIYLFSRGRTGTESSNPTSLDWDTYETATSYGPTAARGRGAVAGGHDNMRTVTSELSEHNLSEYALNTSDGEEEEDNHHSRNMDVERGGYFVVF